MTFEHWLQTRLNAHGANLTVDGAIGPDTRAAIRDFQRRRKLKQTGLADDATVERLAAGYEILPQSRCFSHVCMVT